MIAQLVERSPVEFQACSTQSAIGRRFDSVSREEKNPATAVSRAWGISSNGRALCSQRRGSGIDTRILHARSHVVQVVRIVGFHPIDPGSSPGVGVEISVSVCRRGLVGYDAAFTLLRSWVRIPPFVHCTDGIRLLE